MQKRSKIGIMGGTFNPIHCGHLILAENAYDLFNLDTVLIMPSGVPPHKNDKDIAPAKHRIRMVQLAIEDNKHLEYSKIEIERPGVTYTVETLAELAEQYKDTDFYFIIGADSLFDLEDWKEPEQLFKLCTFLVAVRDNISLDDIKDRIKYLQDKYSGRLFVLSTPNIEISSHNIRDRVKTNRTIKYIVPKDIEHYIYMNNLYKE